MQCSPKDQPEQWRLASPIDHVDENAPPLFVIHGTHDCLAYIEDAQHFVAALRKHSKQPLVYAELPGAQHAFDIFRSRRSEITVDAVCRFLEHVHGEHLRKKNASR